jgi:hypothetical protein
MWSPKFWLSDCFSHPKLQVPTRFAVGNSIHCLSFTLTSAGVADSGWSGWRIIERSTHVIMAGGQMIWAFARDSQPAFPAVACLQVTQVDDSLQAIVETRCQGAKEACEAVVAKAKTKDWSNLFGE